MITFAVGILVYWVAIRIHGDMPYWYCLLCFIVVDIAQLTTNAWVQFELFSILGVIAMTRDLVKKGLA